MDWELSKWWAIEYSYIEVLIEDEDSMGKHKWSYLNNIWY